MRSQLLPFCSYALVLHVHCVENARRKNCRVVVGKESAVNFYTATFSRQDFERFWQCMHVVGNTVAAHHVK